MLIYERDRVCYLPIDFIEFNIDLLAHSLGDVKTKLKAFEEEMRYRKECSLNGKLFANVNAFIETTSYQYYILDFNNVVSVPSRAFQVFRKKLDKVIFANVKNESLLAQIEEDTGITGWENNTHKPEKCLDETIDYLISKGRELKYVEIVKKVISQRKPSIHLLSSGLFSNYYINIKQLFCDVEGFQFIVFSLAEKLYKHINEDGIDAVVSSSKNGAIIANILAGLLDIKEVHLLGIGPQYAMEIGDSLEYIRHGKKYAYVFDFMCTGTEAKIVSALINSKKAYLPYAIGVASYKKNTCDYPIRVVDQLVDTEMMNIKYSISGEKIN